MKYEIIFCIVAAALTAGVIGLFAWRLLSGRSDPSREWRRIEENLEGLREEHARNRELLAGGRMSQKEFEDREEELALRVMDETAPEAPERERNARAFPLATLLAVAVIVPATSIGAYMWQGDFSALDDRAIEQIRTTREAARSERDMAGTVTQLERAVESNRDNLEAWELLAEQYNATGNLSQAAIAYENVTRLKPADANAWAELADLTIALNPEDLVKAGDIAQRALAVDPWQQKALMIGAAAAYEKGDYRTAAVLFARLRSQIPEGNDVHDALTQQIEMTLQAGGLKEVPADTVGKKPETDLEKMMRLGGGAAPGRDLMAPEGDGVGLNPLGK